MTPEEFIAQGAVMTCHLTGQTFLSAASNGSEIGVGWAEDINLFNPTALDLDDYLDRAQRIGCGGSMFTWMHDNGAAMWNSTVQSARAINATKWYSLNGQIEVAAEHARATRARNMRVGQYFDIGNSYFYHNNGSSWTGAAAHNLPILAEMVGRCLPDWIIIDGVGDTWTGFGGLGYNNLPHADIVSTIRTASPNTLIGINDHSDANAQDFSVYESTVPFNGVAGSFPGPTAGATAPNGLVLWWIPDGAQQTISGTPFWLWFQHDDQQALTYFDARTMVGREGLMRSRQYVHGHNMSISSSGTLTTNQKATLALLEDKQPDVLYVDDNFSLKYSEANDIAVQTRVARDGIAWVKTFGSVDFKVGPQGEMWINGSTSDYQKRVTLPNSNYVVEAEFEFKGGTIPSNWAVTLFHTADAGATHDYRYGVGSSSSSLFFTSLDRHDTGALHNLDSEFNEVTIDPTKVCMIRLLRRGATMIAQLWQDGIKRSQLQHDDSTFTSAEYPGLEMTCSAASDTTGVHVTRFRVYSENTTAPLPPSLLTARRTDEGVGDVLLEWNAPETLRAVRVYRAEADSNNFVMLKEVAGNVFIDDEADVNTAYLYYLKAQDNSYNVSAASNTLSVIASRPGGLPTLSEIRSEVRGSTPINQVPVPSSRTWVLKQGNNGLAGELPIIRQHGETNQIFAIDWRNDLFANGRVVSLDSITVLSGPTSGITISNADGATGVDRSQSKHTITLTTPGTYVIHVAATYDHGDGVATVTLIVT